MDSYIYVHIPVFARPVLWSPESHPRPPPPERSALFPISDPEFLRDNPIEVKQKEIARSHRRGLLDRNLKVGVVISLY